MISAYTSTMRIEGFANSFVEVPVIGTILQISVRVVLSYLLIESIGLKAVALATGIGWAAIVVYQIITPH